MTVLLKHPALFFSLILFALCTPNTFAVNNSLQAIAERIAPVGKVNVEQPKKSTTLKKNEAEKITETTKAVNEKETSLSNGEKIYAAHCKLCHEPGIAGAPKLTDAKAWQARGKQGIAALVEHAIKGYKTMPPRGGCVKCTNEDINAAVEYMLKQVQA
jgi:cytochrome c5